MGRFAQYELPVKGLKNGIHTYEFHINEAFFNNFPDTPVVKANIEVLLKLDKRPEMFILDFAIEGFVETDCDRCLAPIQLPIKGIHQLLVKLKEDTGGENDPDVVFVDPEISKFGVAEYLYEYVVLAIPMKKVIDCNLLESKPCDFDTLKRMENKQIQGDHPFMDALKNWSVNN